MLIELSITLEPGTVLKDAEDIRERILKSVSKDLEYYDNQAIVGSSLTVED